MAKQQPVQPTEKVSREDLMEFISFLQELHVKLGICLDVYTGKYKKSSPSEIVMIGNKSFIRRLMPELSLEQENLLMQLFLQYDNHTINFDFVEENG